jgi:hypothetical protein
MNTITNLASIHFNLSNISNITPSEPIKMPKTCQYGECKFKLKISDFSCKCNKYFCSKHRHFSDHSCEYDYRTNGNKQLEKQLIKVNGDKIAEKI